MERANLRVYYGPDEDSAPCLETLETRPVVTLSLGELLPLLADALLRRRKWVHDFAEDEVAIPADLHQVLLAFKQYRQA